MDAGFRWAYLMEAIFFLYVILSNYKNIPNHTRNVVLLNMSLIFCAILLFFIRSENGGRLGWIYMIGIICTLADICVEKRKLNRFGMIMMIVSFLLFVRIYRGWQNSMLGLYPYKTFLSDGYRNGDPIRERFEYDFAYDEDKFYRPAFRFLE
jgi:hypothetical protein